MKKEFLLSIWQWAFCWALLLCFPAYAQQRVSGRVVDDKSAPLPGVNIVVKGTLTGTMTDLDGQYSLALPEGGSPVLVFSFVGYQKKEVPAVAGRMPNVVLQEDLAQLDEVVVVGYGTQRKSDLTGAVAVVESKELKQAAVTGVDQAMQGRIPGVQVVANSGAPGASIQVRIRGIGTVNNSDPLYVVDGVPTGGIDFLNPADVENITVLKDASATAIYGSRGANGVVLITTKSGKKGEKAQVSFETYVGVQQAWKQLDLADAQTWATLKNEARRADGLAPLAGLENPATLGKGTDWQSELFRTGLMQNHQVSVSGGGEKSTYLASVNHVAQEGIVHGSDFARTTFRLNNTFEASKHLKVGNNLSLIRVKRHTIPENYEFDGQTPLNGALTADPATPVFKSDGGWASSTFNNIRNPMAVVGLLNNVWNSNRLMGNVFAELALMEGLRLRSSYGMDLQMGEFEEFQTKHYQAAYFQNPNNSYNKERQTWSSDVWTNTLLYDFELGRHSFNAMLGQELQRSSWERLSARRMNLAGNVIDRPSIDAGDVSTSVSGGARSESALLSYFGRLNYNFDDRYLLTANFRTDGSSRFGSSNRWGYFPSFAAAWNLHNEGFLKQVSMLSQLKLRAGWGIIGNQNIGDYPYVTLVDANQYYMFGNTRYPGSAPLSVGNREVKWESTITTNIGVDLGLWADRLVISAEYFDKLTSDMLVRVPIPDHVGVQTPPFVNAGEVRNRGLEISAQYKGQAGELQYQIGGNATFLRNRVESLGQGGNAIDAALFRNVASVSRTDVGHPIASHYGYVMDGIFQNEQQVAASAQAETAVPGDVRYKDLNGDGKIDESDRTYIGNPTPKVTFGFNLGATYKGFDLNVFFQGSYGNDIFNGLRYYHEGTGFGNFSNAMLNRWTGEGSTDEYPRLTENGAARNLLVSSRFIEDGSYLRLKNAQLGYTLPVSLTERVGVTRCRVYVSGQNLLTLTRYSGMDPEIGTGRDGGLDQGIDRGYYPQARTFLAGLQVTF